MIREKLTIKVSGDSREQILEEIAEILKNYIDLDSDIEEIIRSTDMEIEVESDGDIYKATAYIRIKN